MSTYDEMLKVWGLSKLVEAGYKASDSSKVYVDFDSEWSGGCETCGWDIDYIIIAYQGISKARIKYESTNVEELLKEVMEFAVKNS